MIIHHVPHRGADYFRPLQYYTQAHLELPQGGYVQVLDEHGFPQPRKHCRTMYINALGEDDDPEHFPRDCLLTNLKYRKNRSHDEVKTHEYIISHDASDRPRMTVDDLKQEARSWATQFGQGYQILVSIHRDTDNDHIHITINSVRDRERLPRSWMRLGKDGQPTKGEISAGGKHQQSVALRCAMNEWALAYAREHGILEEDNNAKARIKTEKRYEKRNDELRDALLTCASQARNLRELESLLRGAFGMTLTVRGQTVSLRHPAAKKATRLRSLGLARAELEALLAERPSGVQLPLDSIGWERYLKEDQRFWDTYRMEKDSCRNLIRDAYGQMGSLYVALREMAAGSAL